MSMFPRLKSMFSSSKRTVAVMQEVTFYGAKGYLLHYGKTAARGVFQISRCISCGYGNARNFEYFGHFQFFFAKIENKMANKC